MRHGQKVDMGDLVEEKRCPGCGGPAGRTPGGICSTFCYTELYGEGRADFEGPSYDELDSEADE